MPTCVLLLRMKGSLGRVMNHSAGMHLAGSYARRSNLTQAERAGTEMRKVPIQMKERFDGEVCCVAELHGHRSSIG
jgi:hypothetical protein